MWSLSKPVGTILVLLSVFLLSPPAYAKYGGGSGTADDPHQIGTAEDLIALGETPEDYDKHFILTADIDLDPNLAGGKVFDKAVIAPETDPTRDEYGYGSYDGKTFSGVFDGNGQAISRLTVTGESYVGLFGYLDSGAQVKNLGVVDVRITGSGHHVGGLAGENSYGTVTDCYSTGSVSGASCVGGLVGENWGFLTRCFSNGAITGTEGDVGGLIGYNGGFLTRCHSMGSVIGTDYVGGLIGRTGFADGTVAECYSTARVNGKAYVGGLVGYNDRGDVTGCYSMGTVAGTSSVGGLIGFNIGDIKDSYAIACITGSSSIGGLVGTNGDHGGAFEWWEGTISKCYSASRVTGANSVGGLVGYNDEYMEIGQIENAFWDIQVSGLANMCGGKLNGGGVCDDTCGKTTAEMQDANTFMVVGWDFVDQVDGSHDIWAEPTGGGYPILSWQLPHGFGLPTFSGGTGEPNDPYLLSIAEELNSIGHNPRLMKCHFKLVSNLDLGGIHFYPIGNLDYTYIGVFDGDGHTISHLTVTGKDYVGLFGCLASGALVENLGIEDVNITGSNYVGGLAGSNGTWYREAGSVTSCYTTGSVSGESSVGGLVGETYGTTSQCYSTGAITGTQWGVGGLVGYNSGTVTQCYSTGQVNGGSNVGGLMGQNWGSVIQCYSTGTVGGDQSVGGLAGSSWAGTVTGCFWDTQTSGQTTSAGGTGKTTAEMQTAKTFLDAGWDFVNIWGIGENQTYPYLRKYSAADINQDASVNFLDLAALAENWLTDISDR